MEDDWEACLYSLVHGRDANPFGNSLLSLSKSCHISSSMFDSMEPLPGKELYSCGFRKDVEPMGLSCAHPYINIELPFLLFELSLSFVLEFELTATMNRLESRLRGFMRFRAMVSLISSSSCFLPGRNLIFVSFSSTMSGSADADNDEDEEDANSISGEEKEEGRVILLFFLLLILLVAAPCSCSW